MAGGHVKFKHFESKSGDELCKEMQEWVNGETDYVTWVNEFHVVESDGILHSFVKYIETEEEE